MTNDLLSHAPPPSAGGGAVLGRSAAGFRHQPRAYTSSSDTATSSTSVRSARRRRARDRVAVGVLQEHLPEPAGGVLLQQRYPGPSRPAGASVEPETHPAHLLCATSSSGGVQDHFPRRGAVRRAWQERSSSGDRVTSDEHGAPRSPPRFRQAREETRRRREQVEGRTSARRATAPPGPGPAPPQRPGRRRAYPPLERSLRRFVRVEAEPGGPTRGIATGIPACGTTR